MTAFFQSFFCLCLRSFSEPAPLHKSLKDRRTTLPWRNLFPLFTTFWPTRLSPANNGRKSHRLHTQVVEGIRTSLQGAPGALRLAAKKANPNPRPPPSKPLASLRWRNPFTDLWFSSHPHSPSPSRFCPHMLGRHRGKSNQRIRSLRSACIP